MLYRKYALGVIMWESPIYKFKLENGKKEILIDVTGSAPNFKVPGIQLEGTFKEVLKGLDPSRTKILDFGAAKLRNTIYLLKKGYTVYSCEFKDLFSRSQQANDFYEEAKKYDNFKPLIFPDQFIDLDEKFDVIMLINVINIMPVAMERLCVIALCREKLKENGRLLWYTQHGAYDYDEAVAKIFDGIVTGEGRQYHMFYRDFSRNEIHELLRSQGFTFNNDFKFGNNPNQVYTFNPDGVVLIDKTLGLLEMLKKKSRLKLKAVERETRWQSDEKDKETEKVVYSASVPTKVMQVKQINILETYAQELDNIKAGKKDARKYQELIFNILKIVFDGCLKKPHMETPHANNTQRVDITFVNHREKGFFKQLDGGYHLTCPNIYIECKNYSEDLKNPEYAQMGLRLSESKGQFGMIICRKIIDGIDAEKRQEQLVRDKKYVIILEDSDIKKIVKLKLDGKEDAIDDHLEEKYKKLT